MSSTLVQANAWASPEMDPLSLSPNQAEPSDQGGGLWSNALMEAGAREAVKLHVLKRAISAGQATDRDDKGTRREELGGQNRVETVSEGVGGTDFHIEVPYEAATDNQLQV